MKGFSLSAKWTPQIKNIKDDVNITSLIYCILLTFYYKIDEAMLFYDKKCFW